MNRRPDTPEKARGRRGAPLPHLRDESMERCESCRRRRRVTDLIRGVCRVCVARAEWDDAWDWHRDQDEAGW